MQDRWDAVQVGYSSGGIQDKRDADTGRMQDRSDAGQDGCRIGGMQNMRDAGHEGCRS